MGERVRKRRQHGIPDAGQWRDHSVYHGDLQVDGGNHVLETVEKEDLKADIVQMAHHGQACRDEKNSPRQ
ncbi:MAG: hypothetical protein ACLUD2_03145 [Clostridium sp.]